MSNKNIAGLVRNVIANGSKVFTAEVGVSEGGVTSFRVYAPAVTEEGEVTMRDVTKMLRNVPGVDLPTRGRPRTEVVVRSRQVGRKAAHKVLAARIAHALYGEEGTINVQAL